MTHRIPHYLAVVAFLVMPQAAMGEEAKKRQFLMPSKGSLQLKIPKILEMDEQGVAKGR